jgi:MFS family permease
MANARNVPMLMGGFALLGLSFSFATPGISGSASMAVEPHEQGAAAGYLSAANTSGAILGPLVGPALYNIAPYAPMAAGCVLMLVMTVFAFTIPAPQQKTRSAE